MRLIAYCLFSLLLISCSQPKEWQGYNEGRYTYISAQFPGTLIKLNVERGSLIQAGQPLLVLEPQPESDELHQARADVLAAEANKQSAIAALAYSKITLQRNIELFHKNAIQESEVDNAQKNYDKDKASVDQMQANLISSQAALVKAQWTVAQKILVAPKSGVVFDTYFREGELVPQNQAILSLLAPENIKVIFYVSETELGRMKLGQAVKVLCDGCSTPIMAKVSFISPQAEYTPPVIYSNETRAKLVFRIEAAPALGQAFQLHPGQPVRILALKSFAKSK